MTWHKVTADSSSSSMHCLNGLQKWNEREFHFNTYSLAPIFIPLVFISGCKSTLDYFHFLCEHLLPPSPSITDIRYRDTEWMTAENHLRVSLHATRKRFRDDCKTLGSRNSKPQTPHNLQITLLVCEEAWCPRHISCQGFFLLYDCGSFLVT